jgi:tRNA(Arg) A34 adenosine deaminase TadA
MWLFVTNSPCIICARAIYQAGIEKVIYMAEHTDLDGLKFLKKSKIKLEKLPKEIVFKDF